MAATVAYAGWWITGLIVWFLEREDKYVRFHAAQSCVAFGAIALIVAVLAAAAGVALIVAPTAFAFWIWTAGLALAAGIALWVAAMWFAATGRAWRIPAAAKLADRMCRR